MNKKKIKHSCLLVLTALIWGVAFVAQRKGGDATGPLTFNGIRFLIGGAVLLPVIWWRDRREKGTAPEKKDTGTVWIAGISCGFFLFAASSLQQLGISIGGEVGKAGFLTACYILIVPILGLFFGKKCGWNVWLGVLLTVGGLYLLCMTGRLSLRFSDTILLLCALLFAMQILVIDHFAPKVDSIKMACIQFFFSGLCGMIPMFWIDMQHSLQGIRTWSRTLVGSDVWIPLLYTGILSSGVGYTLQIIGQEGLNPTVASLLMSLESVFSVLAGVLLLGERLSLRELAGCVLIFAAIVLAQIPVSARRERNGSASS